MDYNTYEDLHNLIKKAIGENYALASANIIFLEEFNSRSYVVYMTQIRDVFSHLTNVYCTDVMNNKDFVIEQIERARGHLERIVIDSFRNIIDRYLYTIEKSNSWRDFYAYRTQIANKVKELRMCDETLSYSEKVEGFKKVISYMEDVLKKNK